MLFRSLFRQQLTDLLATRMLAAHAGAPTAVQPIVGGLAPRVLMRAIERLRSERGLTLLLITHDMGLVARHSERALVLYAGRVAEEAGTRELFAAPRHPYTRGLLASVPRAGARAAGPDGRFRAIPGGVPDLPDRRTGACAFAPRCGDRFAPCDSSEPPLYETSGARVRCFLYEASE